MGPHHTRKDLEQRRKRYIQSLFLATFCLALAVLLITFPKEYGTIQITSNTSSKVESSQGTHGFQLLGAQAGSVSCDPYSYRTSVCQLTGDIRVTGNTVAVLGKFNADQHQHELLVQKIKPYPRKWQKELLKKITEFHVMALHAPAYNASLACDVRHSQPGLVFSTGGYTGSIYHDFNDGLIPLYVTSRLFQGEVVFMISEFRPWWMKKYGGIIGQLSKYSVVDVSSDKQTHCFPQVTVGLRFHDELAVDTGKMKEAGGSMKDFQSMLRVAFGNPGLSKLRTDDKPTMVLITRRRTRALNNVEEVVELAKGMGFTVHALEPGVDVNMTTLYNMLQSADVLVGVHGAALTHLLFMRPGSVLLQIVPLGTDSPALSFYGNPAIKAGLQYMEYRISPSESSLAAKLGLNHSAVTKPPKNPGSTGWSDMKKLYLERQNVTLSIRRFKPVLREALERAVVVSKLT